MSDARLPAAEAVESHVRAFFDGHCVEVVDFDLGPERREVVVDGLCVLVVGPGPRSDSWAYVTAGCWAAMEKDGHGLEFVMTAHVRDQRFVELMAMIAYYHCGGHQLDLEHSMPIGEPWVPGSACDHLLISLPYLHGPDLEHCPLPGGYARIPWTLPARPVPRTPAPRMFMYGEHNSSLSYLPALAEGDGELVEMSHCAHFPTGSNAPESGRQGRAGQWLSPLRMPRRRTGTGPDR
ncbi:hypothetical protein [Streptomyces sp. NPDC050564]|uniref:hypothetical protein n=1 Tax=Streptomyces sp. NPDC050564 TaxID=3365631 RepID=UPI0037874FDE